MDLLLANTPAIILGMTVIRKGGWKTHIIIIIIILFFIWLGFLEYDWLGRKNTQSVKDWGVFKWFLKFLISQWYSKLKSF